jgi:hypothetical protein
MRENDETRRKYSIKTSNGYDGSSITASYKLDNFYDNFRQPKSYDFSVLRSGPVYEDKVGNYGSGKPGEYESAVGKYD